MLKADRDWALNSLSDQDRSAYRQILRDLEAERKAPPGQGRSLRELLGSRLGESPPGVRAALEAVIARDETGPKVGEQPPDFLLQRLDTRERISLSSFRGRRPVVLVFGSYA